MRLHRSFAQGQQQNKVCWITYHSSIEGAARPVARSVVRNRRRRSSGSRWRQATTMGHALGLQQASALLRCTALCRGVPASQMTHRFGVGNGCLTTTRRLAWRSAHPWQPSGHANFSQQSRQYSIPQGAVRRRRSFGSRPPPLVTLVRQAYRALPRGIWQTAARLPPHTPLCAPVPGHLFRGRSVPRGRAPGVETRSLERCKQQGSLSAARSMLPAAPRAERP